MLSLKKIETVQEQLSCTETVLFVQLKYLITVLGGMAHTVLLPCATNVEIKAADG